MFNIPVIVFVFMICAHMHNSQKESEKSKTHEPTFEDFQTTERVVNLQRRKTSNKQQPHTLTIKSNDGSGLQQIAFKYDKKSALPHKANRISNQHEISPMTPRRKYMSVDMHQREPKKLLYQKNTTVSGALAEQVLQITSALAGDVEYAVVVVSTQPHLHQITTHIMTSGGSIPTFYINEEFLGYQELDEIRKTKFQEKKQLLYLVIDVQYYMMELVEDIQIIDNNARIAVLPSDRVDPHQFYKELRLYNVYLITKSAHCCSYHVYEVCQYCDDGSDQVNTINMWVPGRGFIQQLVLPPSFKKNFHKTNFVVATEFMYPYIYVNGTDEVGNDIVTGEGVFQKLDTLSKTINATFHNNVLRSIISK